MKLLLAIAIILVISVLGSRLTFLNRRLSLGFRNLFFTGTEYIFIGAILGNMGFNVLDANALSQFEPFLVVGLCWVGFLFGLQFKFRQLKNLPTCYFSLSAAQSFAAFLLVTVSTYFLLGEFLNLSNSELLFISITLGSTASCTAQSALAIVSQNYRFKNRRLLDLMRYISGIDGIYALIFFIVALNMFPGGKIEAVNVLISLQWLGVSVAMGVIPALILISLCRLRFTNQEFLVFLIGTVMFCGGLAHQIHYSPLISGLVCGIITANFSRHHLRALSEVMQAEKSIYIILLLLMGAGWDLKLDFSILIAVVYVIARLLGKFGGTLVGSKLFNPSIKIPPTLGLGLISDGGLAVAIYLTFKQLYPQYADIPATIIIFSILANEVVSPWLILKQFKKDERTLVRRKQKTGEFKVQSN